MLHNASPERSPTLRDWWRWIAD